MNIGFLMYQADKQLSCQYAVLAQLGFCYFCAWELAFQGLQAKAEDLTIYKIFETL